MKFLFRLAVLLLSLSYTAHVFAQARPNHTTWTYELKKIKDKQYKAIFHLKLDKDWHIYSMKPGGDGSLISPTFDFDSNPSVKANGGITESGKLISEKMEGIDGIVNLYKDHVDYTQLLTITKNGKVSGKYSFQVCDDKMCLPPSRDNQFLFQVKDAGGADTTAAKDTAATVAVSAAQPDTIIKTQSAPVISSTADTAAKNAAAADSKKDKPSKGLLWLFLASLIGGLLGVTTPCVYSMIPITVSFFTKRSKDRRSGIRNAIYYSLSIISIFTVLGIVISVVFGANALNNLSTNWIANLFFFVVFVVFGISFLGAFDIQLPSTWTSKTDSKANTSSFVGIFFMALTLVIVSFSCTGPIVGPLLVLAGKGGVVGPAVGMFGFSLGLALPFALFAIFPGWLNGLSKGGGWLNQVKVTLGFIELMLAMKFFSNADLARGWRLLDREIFIAVWIVLSVLLGLYLLGKLKLSHDDADKPNVYGVTYVPLLRLFLAIAAFAFAVYLAPGMIGAPLNGMSQFLPPMGTIDFNAGSGEAKGVTTVTLSGPQPVKYVQEFKIYEPPIVKQSGLVPFYDYKEALAASKVLKKPVMLDFTGINCVNCRKMESQVWSNPEVMRRLKEDFIVVSLYCDYDKIQLPKAEQYFSKALNSQVVTVGDGNEALQAEKFNSSGQPIYFYVDADDVKLADEGYSYDPDASKFIRHLDAVKAKYKSLHP